MLAMMQFAKIVMPILIMAICIDGESAENVDQTDAATSDKAVNKVGERTKKLCNYKIAENAANKFQHLVNDKHMNFMYIKGNFSQEPAIPKNNLSLFPYFFTWTFKGEAGAGYPILFYPFDFDVLSLGFLSWYVYDYLEVNVEMSPAGCEAEWGAPDTMRQLLLMLRNLTDITNHHDTTVWCYAIKFKLSQFYNFIVHVTGVNRDSSGFQCSEPENPHQFSETYEQTRWLIFLQVCGGFLLCYSPLFLYVFDGRSENEIKAVKLDKWINNNREDYEEIKELVNNDEHAQTDEPILYLGDEPPVTFMSLFKWCFHKFSTTQSLFLGRLSKIFLLVVIAPIFIYIQMIVYYRYKHGAVHGRIQQDIPVGFNAIPFGFKASNRNWMYFLGGPYVIYSLFFIMAGTILCIPDNISAILCAQLCDANDSKLLQYLEPVIIENLGGLKFTSMNVGWSMFATAMRARLYMLLNWKFWKLFTHTWIQRLRSLVRKKPDCLPKCIFFILMIPVWLFCVLVIILDLVVCIIYYGVPIWLLTKNLVVNYIAFCVDRFIWKKVNRQNVFLNWILVWTMKIFIFIVFFYVLCCYYTIYTVSMTYIYQTISFTLIGVVAFPSEAITYTVMYTTIILYVWKAVKHINHSYIDLLYETIHISEHLEKSKPIDKSVAYIIYYENIPGVYQHVFDHLVEKHLPLRVQLFLCAGYLSIIGSFVYSSISVVQAYNRQAQLSVVVQAIAAVMAGIIPQLVEFFWSSANSSAKRKRFKCSLEYSIVMYWKNRNRYLSESESLML